MEHIKKYINENQSRFIDELIEILKIPSISADPKYKNDVLYCADVVASFLKKAGADEADMIIAVTLQDEINMVACQMAHTFFKIPRKIARLRSEDFLNPIWRDLYNADNMPIDLIISPELEVAKSIERQLKAPGAFDVVPFLDD